MKIKVGIIGLGFIGVSHIEAIRRIGFADILAIADTNYDKAKQIAKEYCIPKCYENAEALLENSEIDVVHNCTPNHLHVEINEKIIKSGKHILSEKPLARTSDESKRLLGLLKNNKTIIAGVNFNYRMNPLVLDMKYKIKNGEIGSPRLAHGSFLQDWLLYDTDYNWRIEPELCGPSRCIADIGSHWMDTVQFIVGGKITKVCSDLLTVIPKRKKPLGQVETFSQNNSNIYEEKEIETEDYGAVMFKMDNGIHGVFYVSQVSAGRGCYLNFEIDGSQASMYWNQEVADQMWMGFRDKGNLQILKNPMILSKEAREYVSLAKGHPEGWSDAFRNNIYSFYKYIIAGKINEPHEFASFEEAHYIAKITDAILKSNQMKAWVSV